MSRREPFASKTNRRVVRAAERSALALQLRLQGYTYAEIAERVGYKSKSAAHLAVMREIRRIPAPYAEELRQVEMERLEIALRALYPKVIRGDCNAIKRWTDVIELQCRMLGLLAPTQVAHGVVNDEQDPLFRILDEVARRLEARDVADAEVSAASGAEADSA